MIKEEAIKILEPFKACMFDQHGCPISDVAIALDVAIDALEEQKTGRWIQEWGVIDEKTGQVCWRDSCSECSNFGHKDMNYCPNCGAKMESY